MKRDLTKNHSNWINGFTKEQFDIFIKEFIRIFFGVDTVVLVDGSGDGGLDMKILDSGKKRKIPMQITVEKKVYYKLKKDIPKISKLIDEHNYSDTFYFFYSLSSAETNIDDLIDEARKLGFTLIPFDSKILGEYVEKPGYERLRQTIRNLLGDFLDKEEKYFDNYEKMRFDLICYNDDSFEIKNRTLTSFVLFEVYNCGEVLVTELLAKLKDKFQLKEIDFVHRLINKLRGENKITITGIAADQKISLTVSERERIDLIKEEIDFQEKYFIHQLTEILKRYNLENKINEILQEIYDLYKSHYIKDYLEINEIPDNGGFQLKLVDDYRDYLNKLLGNKEDTKEIAIDILEICNYNNFLQKLGAGQLFSSLIKSTEFDQYLNRQPKTVYLDASVLIYIICYLANEHSEFDNVYFKVAKDIINYKRKGETKINLLVSFNYVQEAALHLQNAINLVPFTKLAFFNRLGSSSNIYYNFYLYQYRNNELDENVETFDDFLKSIGIDADEIKGEKLYDFLSETLGKILEDEGIQVFQFVQYYYKERKYYEEIEKQLAYTYQAMSTVRTKSALVNDSMMLCELYDEQIEKIDPTFLTYDNSFFHFRKRYHRQHPAAPYWYLFRPAKYLDHLSLINFKINSEALVKDIFTIMDDEFDIQHRVKYLNDALVRLVDLKTASGMKLTKGLSDLRSQRIYSVHVEYKDSYFIEQQPIDDFVVSISKYYFDKRGKYDVNKFKEFLENEAQIDKVIQYFTKELDNFISAHNKELQINIFQKMDNLIDESITEGQQS